MSSRSVHVVAGGRMSFLFIFYLFVYFLKNVYLRGGRAEREREGNGGSEVSSLLTADNPMQGGTHEPRDHDLS